MAGEKKSANTSLKIVTVGRKALDGNFSKRGEEGKETVKEGTGKLRNQSQARRSPVSLCIRWVCNAAKGKWQKLAQGIHRLS